MKTDAAFWLGLAAVVIAVALELADRFWRPLPWWRKVRGPVAMFLAGVWAVLVFRRTDKPGAEPPKVVEPKEYNDGAATENEKAALDTDVDAAGDAAVDPSLDELQSELDSL